MRFLLGDEVLEEVEVFSKLCAARLSVAAAGEEDRQAVAIMLALNFIWSRWVQQVAPERKEAYDGFVGELIRVTEVVEEGIGGRKEMLS